MGLNLFKKVNFADTIFENGNIFTQNAELPWAEAVAVKDGKVIAVGSSGDMSSMYGPDTNTVDLNGKFMYPGFIDCHRAHTLRLFNGKYINLFQAKSPEEAAAAIEYYIDDNPDKDVIFAYGFDAGLLPDDPNDWENPLDKIETDKPIVVLGKSTIEVWTNQVAKDIARETAEEESVDIITPQYILNLLLPFDFDELASDFTDMSMDLAEHGFTTVLDLQAPSYLQQFFSDSAIANFNEGTLKQRIYLTQFENVPLRTESLIYMLDRQKTMCTELGSLIHADTLNIYLDNEHSKLPFNEEYLLDVLSAVSDRGYNFFIEAIEKSDLDLAYRVVDGLRGKGYKNNVVIASDHELDAEDKKELLFNTSVLKTWGSNVMADNFMDFSAENMEEKVDELTVYAAEFLGMEEVLGSIEVGKFADFSVFDQDILKLRKDATLPQCEMTVLNGEIVHDLENEADMELFNMLSKQQF